MEDDDMVDEELVASLNACGVGVLSDSLRAVPMSVEDDTEGESGPNDRSQMLREEESSPILSDHDNAHDRADALEHFQPFGDGATVPPYFSPSTAIPEDEAKMPSVPAGKFINSSLNGSGKASRKVSFEQTKDPPHRRDDEGKTRSGPNSSAGSLSGSGLGSSESSSEARKPPPPPPFAAIRPGTPSSSGSLGELSFDSKKFPVPDIGLAPRYDRLTVFQAAPLIWKDDEETYNVIEMLDFDQERDILETTLQEAKQNSGGSEVELAFETATSDRLGAFLAAAGTQVLHFSCHGNPEFLCIEDGEGGAQFLLVDDLRELMSAGSGELLFVFVSACFSRPAGEAFIKAGVPHVVCCQHDEPLMDSAAREFSRNFYLSLACGRTLREAFHLAKLAVKTCPRIPDAENEMRKFLLLPEDSDHDKPIFFTRPRSVSITANIGPGSGKTHMLPPPPEPFVARELEMYKVMQELKRARLVRVAGLSGSGKTSVAASVAQYISIRKQTFPFDEVIWLPLWFATRDDRLSSCFNELIALLQDEGPAARLQLDKLYRQKCSSVIETLHHTKALVIIETKGFIEVQAIGKLSLFLQDLFKGTKYVRVILVCRPELEVMLSNKVIQSEVLVEPLNFETTAMLFGRICPHVSNRCCQEICTARQLANFLVPKGKEEARLCDPDGVNLTNRCIEIFQLIGKGIPSEIHKCAGSMTTGEFKRLIEIGSRVDYNPDCATRVELELQIGRLNEELQVAVREMKFNRATEIQGILDELEPLREALPKIDDLQRMAHDLRQDMDRAVSDKNYREAEDLSQQLELLNNKIEKENKAIEEYEEDEVQEPKEPEPITEQQIAESKFTTRAALESEIRRIKDELEEAVANRDFGNCQQLQEKIDEYEACRDSLPSLTEISLKIVTLNADLEAAVAAKKFADAQKIHDEIQSLEEQMKEEKESEDSFISVTAIRLGAQLAKLGKELQEAVTGKDTVRAKEIEETLLKEIKDIETKIILRYPDQRDHHDDNTNNNNQGSTESGIGVDSTLSQPGDRGKPPVHHDDQTENNIDRSGHRDDNVKRKMRESLTTVPLPPPQARRRETQPTRPGAVSITPPGMNESPQEDASDLQARSRNRNRTRNEKDEVSQDEQESELQDLSERFERGLCPTCSGPNPTQCFVFKNSNNDPNVRTRIPLTIDGLVSDGVCLVCNPSALLRNTSAVDAKQSFLSSTTPLLPASSFPPRPVSPPTENANSSTYGPIRTPPYPSVPTPPPHIPSANLEYDSDGNQEAGDRTPSVAVATRVDAVAQEEAIERMVRDAIRKVTVGNDQSGSVADEGSQLSNHFGPDAYGGDLAEVTGEHLGKTKQSSKKKSFWKFGKRKNKKH